MSVTVLPLAREPGEEGCVGRESERWGPSRSNQSTASASSPATGRVTGSPSAAAKPDTDRRLVRLVEVRGHLQHVTDDHVDAGFLPRGRRAHGLAPLRQNCTGRTRRPRPTAVPSAPNVRVWQIYVKLTGTAKGVTASGWLNCRLIAALCLVRMPLRWRRGQRLCSWGGWRWRPANLCQVYGAEGGKEER